MTIELVIAIVANVFSLGISAGIVIARLKVLEKKQDKHNNLIERVTKTESSVKSISGDIKEIKEDISLVQNDVMKIKIKCAERGGSERLTI